MNVKTTFEQFQSIDKFRSDKITDIELTLSDDEDIDNDTLASAFMLQDLQFLLVDIAAIAMNTFEPYRSRRIFTVTFPLFHWGKGVGFSARAFLTVCLAPAQHWVVLCEHEVIGRRGSMASIA